MIMDYGRERIGPGKWTFDTWIDYKKLIEDAKKIDEKLGEPNCEDPAKTAWMKEIEDRLKRLEDQAKQYQQPEPQEHTISISYDGYNFGNAINEGITHLSDKISDEIHTLVENFKTRQEGNSK
jgi:hypothetical protein